jgi:hypothetical protein
MTFTRKGAIATGLVAAAVVIYIAYLAFDGIPLVRDVRGMAAVGLVCGFLSRRIGGRAGFAHPRVAFVAGLGSIALGIAALVTESEVVLAVFMASIVGLWLAAMYAHAHAHAVDRGAVAAR